MTNSNTKEVILAKSIDWDPWISFVWKRAKSGRIWEYVDPSLLNKLAQPQYPAKPILTRLEGGTVDPTALEVCKLGIIEYKADLAVYERQEGVVSIEVFVHCFFFPLLSGKLSEIEGNNRRLLISLEHNPKITKKKRGTHQLPSTR